MNIFKRPHVLRRYSKPSNEGGYIFTPYEDMTLPMDVQTLSNQATTEEDGTEAVQKLKVFCDFEILTESQDKQQKADRLWFQGKWFVCRQARLSENTPLRHWTCEFTEALDSEEAPEEVDKDEP